jgi:hypothetical protein
MLGKLFKYEIKSTARQFLSIFTVLIGLAFILKLFNTLSTKLDIMLVPNALFMFLYVVTIIGMFIATVIIALQRFYKNLIGDEGYLMFTLPVDVWKQVFVKTVIAVMWTLAGIIVALLSVLIIAFYGNIFKDISDFLSVAEQSFTMQFGMSIYPLAAKILGIFILAIASGYLMIFTSISIGQLFRSHRVACSVGAYFGIYIINQIFMVTVMTVVSRTNITFWNQIANNDLKVISSWLLLYVALYSAVFVCAYFFCSTYILRKKLNLE